MGVKKGWQGIVRIAANKSAIHSGGTLPPDPMLTSAPFDVATALDKIYIIGTRDPAEIVQGNREISGTVERNYNGSYVAVYATEKTLDQVCAIGETNVSEYAIWVAPNGSGVTPEFYLRGVRFGGYSLGVTAEGMSVESAEWMATNVSSA